MPGFNVFFSFFFFFYNVKQNVHIHNEHPLTLIDNYNIVIREQHINIIISYNIHEGMEVEDEVKVPKTILEEILEKTILDLKSEPEFNLKVLNKLENSFKTGNINPGDIIQIVRSEGE